MYPALRALHSFPTRRSSDLSGMSRSAHPADIGAPSTNASFAYECIRIPTEALVREAGRSEEHTSELQSRFDLVCRLLLEKKKTKPYGGANGLLQCFVIDCTE